jgi:hypothetical protein
VILLKRLAKLLVAALEMPDHFTVLREFPDDWMM